MIRAKYIFRMLIMGALFTTLFLQPVVGNMPGEMFPKDQNHFAPDYEEDAIDAFIARLQSEGDPGQQGDHPEAASLSQRLAARFEAAPIKVVMLVVALLFLFLMMITLALIIMINRSRKASQRKLAAQLKSTYQEQLADYLFGDEEKPVEFKGINNNFNREIFVNELLDFHNNLHGEMAIRLRDLYFNLGLYKDSLKKVGRKRWDLKSKGFREVSQMDVKEAVEEISRHTNSPHAMLRMEAQVAMVKLSEEDPLSFLDDLKYDLSIWEQINIMNVLDYHQINIDSFQRWLSVANDSVVCFALKMTGLLKHSHAAPDIVPLLEHPNPQVRLYAIEALGRLEMPEYLDALKDSYQREVTDGPKPHNAFYHINITKNRAAAVKAISLIATTAEIDFLKHILHQEGEFEILMMTAQTIAAIDPGALHHLEAIYPDASPQLRRIIDNVTQTQVL